MTAISILLVPVLGFLTALALLAFPDLMPYIVGGAIAIVYWIGFFVGRKW